ncbi:MAG: transcription termination/antitermination NusG family protein [Candidatus Cloacimonadota bacterium]|nr:transcription termination/antitermination NusG family protein [Candidatus Cloacimonadota bacterium]
MATNKPVEVNEIFGNLSPAEENQSWEVIYTKPKREKKLADFAYQREISYYLPLIDSVRKYKYRKVKFTKPLFSGYLFVKCNFKEKQTLVTSGHILTFLLIKNENHFLEELRQIHLSRLKGVELQKHKYIEKGTKVIIQKGSLKGMKGFVLDSKRPTEIILKVNILKQAVSVKINPEDIKILKKHEDKD